MRISFTDRIFSSFAALSGNTWTRAMTSVDRPVSSTFSTLDRSYSHFKSPLLTEEKKKNKSACADFTVMPSIVKMEIFANDDRFRFNTLASVRRWSSYLKVPLMRQLYARSLII
jgi:hypothetical protein